MMNDQFNHDHYLHLKHLNEPHDAVISIELETIAKKRHELFPTFHLLIWDETGIFNFLINEYVYLSSDTLNIDNKNIYLLRKTKETTNNKTKIKLSNNSKLIIEDIAVQKNTHHTFIDSLGSNEIYYFSNHVTDKLFYHNILIEVKGELFMYSISKENPQKHKNKIIYELDEKSKLVHNSFSQNSERQLQDDSIEVFHSKESNSIINYTSLNKGHISTQINSIIGKHSEGSETHQHISHTVLSDKAITNSKPNLMIANNDVVASHGSSIGKISEDELFYLSQRGIDKECSAKILTESKLSFMLDKSQIQNEIMSYFKD